MFPGTHRHGKDPMGEHHLLMVIVPWEKRGRVRDVLKRQHGPKYLCRAQGTASSDLTDLLGLGSVDKALLWEFCHACGIPTLQQELAHRAGSGISFSIPLSGVMIPFHGGVRGPREIPRNFEKEVEAMKQAFAHNLIVAVVDEGRCEEVMSAAQSAGARGGTTFHALRFGMEDAARFFGIPLQQKKDVVAILTGREDTLRIMQAVGVLSGKGEPPLLFSLPAANVLGLSEGRPQA